jgi:hypothetical protein
MKTPALIRLLRDVYVKTVLYTNNLYTWWELAIVFAIGFIIGAYFVY